MKKKLESCKLFVFDLDGTLYLGNNVFHGAQELISFINESGKSFIYLTNNSSKAAVDYVKRLEDMGFMCNTEDVLTSGMACANYLMAKYPNKKVHLVGTDALRKELEAYGVLIDDQDAQVVCVGFDRELTYDKAEKAVYFLRKGADFVATNPDLVCPMPNDIALPDCGSICSMLTSSTGVEPFYIGKPNPQMLINLSDKLAIPMEEIAMIGDRLYTDIAIGKNAGATTVCVLSGETTKKMIDDSDIKPDYIFDSVQDIYDHLLMNLSGM